MCLYENNVIGQAAVTQNMQHSSFDPVYFWKLCNLLKLLNISSIKIEEQSEFL